MKKVFICGSRAISHLNGEVTARLENIIFRGHEVLTGDANGVDKAIQRFFRDRAYDDVTIYHIGDSPRNNVGEWRSIAVDVIGNPKGRDLYTQKDRRMAEVADNAMIIWDEKSSGSVQNMVWMISNFKSSLVYMNVAKRFETIKCIDDLTNLLGSIDSEDRAEIDRKISVNRFLNGALDHYAQASLAL
jgi:hypothetical protein